MASDQSVAVARQPPAQVVGNAFAEQFYHILHQSPQLVHQFYQENSKLGRPDPNGTIDSVTTVQGINEKILAAMEYNNYRAEIKTVDAQESLNGGVTVLVTGYLIGKDLVKKDFTQSFFLAPQDKGFFVLNDIFRYVDKDDHHLGKVDSVNGTAASLSSEQDSLPPQNQVKEQTPAPRLEEAAENEEEVYSPPEKEEESVIEEEEASVAEVIDKLSSDTSTVVADLSPAVIVHDEAPKKSYASIVKVMRENTASLSLPTPGPPRPAPIKQERHFALAPVPAQVPELPNDDSNNTENGNAEEAEADNYSIYVKSLPFSATPAQLEEEFKKFGPIKPNGVQVRSHKMRGFCFGFVEFEVASAVQGAIEASPIMIGGRQVFVEEKKTTITRANNGGRFAPGRGAGFRGDGARGRGGYGSGRGYGRGDYNNRADFGNRGGGRSGGYSNRAGDVAYHRANNVGPTGGLGSHLSTKNAAPRVPAPAENGK